MITTSLAAVGGAGGRRRFTFRRWRTVMPWGSLSPPALVLMLWAVAARGFDAYLLYPWRDAPTHFAGGIAGVYCIDALLVALRPWTGRMKSANRQPFHRECSSQGST